MRECLSLSIWYNRSEVYRACSGGEDRGPSQPGGRRLSRSLMPERQLRVASPHFLALLVALRPDAVWTVTTASYFAFREDVLTRLIARQTEMQFGYEDRISEMRAQVDRYQAANYWTRNNTSKNSKKFCAARATRIARKRARRSWRSQ